MGWQKPGRPVVLWAAAIAAILLLVVGALYVSGLTRGQALGPPGEPVPSAAETESPAVQASPSPTPRMLSDADIDSIQGALRSGDEGSIRRILPVATGERLKAGFSSAVAGMGLTIDKQSQKVIDAGIWEVEAVDGEGTRWTLGLIEANQSPRLMYAERASQ